LSKNQFIFNNRERILSFEEFKLSTEILNGLKDINFTEATPVQKECIPLILEGKDIIASAQTGTGKTGAFVIPILSKLGKNPGKGIKALILTPTRELAHQVDEQIMALGYYTGVTSVTVYGGGQPTDWNRQEKALYEEGVNIIVATPGRLIDHLTIKEIDFSGLDYFILDEADRMLDMGFLPDVRTIESRLPQKRQNLLFSATIPVDIEKFARSITNKPERVNIATFKVASGIDQVAYKVYWKQKEQLLLYLLDKKEFTSSIIFVATKKGTDRLANTLSKKGLKVGCMHGDRSQKEREEALRDFKSGKSDILVATDVLSRGIDIDNISHIINYDMPKNVDDYIHRIGRTARAEAEGNAVTFVSKRDNKTLKDIQDVVGEDLQVKSIPDELKNHHNNGKPKSVKGHKKNHKNKSSSSNKKHQKDRQKKPSQNDTQNNNNPNKGGKNKRRRRSKNDRNNKKNYKGSNKKRTNKSHNKASNEAPNEKQNSSTSGKNTNVSSSSNKSSRNKKYSNRRKSDSSEEGNKRKSNRRYKGKKNKFQKESQKSFRERQRQSLRDAHATKKALMSNKVIPNPKSKKEKKGVFGMIKKLFGKDD